MTGSRSPSSALHVLLRVDCCTHVWRRNRVALFLRLLNAPADSLHHAAIMVFKELRTPWFEETLRDLRLVMPSFSVRFVFGGRGYPMLHNQGWWSSDGHWMGAHPWQFGRDEVGYQTRTPLRRGTVGKEVRNVKALIRDWTSQFTTILRSRRDSEVLETLRMRDGVNQHSKTALLAKRLLSPGPALHTALDWVGPVSHRAALTSLLVGDWFLGEYSGNYFAKNLLPHSPAHLRTAGSSGIEPSRVCLHCWFTEKSMMLEDVSHTFWDCPRYWREREDFILELPPRLGELLAACPAGKDRLLAVMESLDPPVWEALGKYAARIRQSRRKMRTEYEHKSAQVAKKSFDYKRTEWRRFGRKVCRHGVFFMQRPSRACPCLDHDSNLREDEWRLARMMPMIDVDLQIIVAAPFDLKSFQRLGILQAELRQKGW